MFPFENLKRVWTFPTPMPRHIPKHSCAEISCRHHPIPLKRPPEGLHFTGEKMRLREVAQGPVASKQQNLCWNPISQGQSP